MKLHKLFIAVVIIGLLSLRSFAAAPATDLARQYPNRALFGTNLSGNKDYGSQFPFADLMKQARPWASAPKTPIETVNEAGYPTAIGTPAPYATVVIGSDHPAGIYVLTWQGQGELSVIGGDLVKVVKKEPGRLELEVKPSKRLMVRIDEFVPEDPIRDVHFWLPGHEGKLFNQAFLDFLRPFGTVRFMDWMETNGSKQQSWEMRPKPDNFTWRLEHSDGVPVEVMVALCNELQVNGWFCMPQLADDDYVRQFATYVHQNLDPRLKAYVEYSNEHWNSSFSVFHYLTKKGKEMGLIQGEGPQNVAYGKRALEIFNIWHEVYGADKARVVRTLGGWSANNRANTLVLNTVGKGNADALAIAPYFGFNKELMSRAEGAMESVDQVLGLAETVITQKVPVMVSDARKLAAQYGMSLIAYEAGQHLLDRDVAKGKRLPDGTRSSDMTKTDLFIAANRDPRMGGLYTKYLHTWFSSGGELICMFSSVGRPSKYGMWGMKETIYQPTEKAPKYKATVEAIAAPNFIRSSP